MFPCSRFHIPICMYKYCLHDSAFNVVKVSIILINQNGILYFIFCSKFDIRSAKYCGKLMAMFDVN